jgi:hypothetical protein
MTVFKGSDSLPKIVLDDLSKYLGVDDREFEVLTL